MVGVGVAVVEIVKVMLDGGGWRWRWSAVAEVLAVLEIETVVEVVKISAEVLGGGGRLPYLAEYAMRVAGGVAVSN